MTTTTNTIAKFAAVVAMIGLVASGFAFAPAAKAQTTAELDAQIKALLAQIAALQGNTGTTAAVTFSQDLTLGSSGAQVTALQNWLMSKGYTIAAGATGYFGAQTQAALAKYQAASGISPAAGYFGPITRAQVNATAGGSTGTGTGTGNGTGTGSSNDGDLSGGEANLTDFDLVREEADGAEGEEEVEVATAEFDVEDGDVRVERLELELQAASSTLGDRPWDYIDNVSIWADGDMIADMDTDSRSDWDENDDDDDHDASSADYYTLSFTGLDYVVEEGDRAELTIAVNVASSIDSADLAQEFTFTIADDGIRAVDAEGIQQYVGDNESSNQVDFGFGAEENGDLSINSSDEDPETATLIADEDEESEEYSVFIFNIENDEDVEALVTDLTIRADVTTGFLDGVVRRATLVVDGDEFDGDINGDVTGTADDDTIAFEDLDLEIGGDDEVEAELMITLVRSATNTQISFEVDGDDVEAEGLESGDETEVTGSAESEDHTVATTGIAVTAKTDNATPVYNLDTTSTDDQGKYTFEIDVMGVEEDAYVALTGTRGTSTNPALSGVQAYIEDVAGAVILTGTTTVAVERVEGGTVDGNYLRINDGQTAKLRVTVYFDAATTGQYRAQLHAVNFANDDVAGTTQQILSPEEDYQSESVQVLN